MSANGKKSVSSQYHEVLLCTIKDLSCITAFVLKSINHRVVQFKRIETRLPKGAKLSTPCKTVLLRGYSGIACHSQIWEILSGGLGGRGGKKF